MILWFSLLINWFYSLVWYICYIPPLVRRAWAGVITIGGWWFFLKNGHRKGVILWYGGILYRIKAYSYIGSGYGGRNSSWTGFFGYWFFFYIGINIIMPGAGVNGNTFLSRDVLVK